MTSYNFSRGGPAYVQQQYTPLGGNASNATESFGALHGPSPAVTPLSYDAERNHSGFLGAGEPLSRQYSDPAESRDTIPLTQQHPKYDNRQSMFASQDQSPMPQYAPEGGQRDTKTMRIIKRTPWLIYTLSLIQVIVFIVELVKNAQLTGSPIETKPSFNPMVGPSPYVLINMGARYVPCMRNEWGIQTQPKTIPIGFPCPNTTDARDTSCSLTQLCGMSPAVPNPNDPSLPHTIDQTPAPNQWFRFITPIFLHGGFIHIGANLLLQIILGKDLERAIGPVRLFIVYFSSGIFGFVMGGNFAPSGLSSTGCSGCLFGLIGLVFIDLLYTWRERKHPVFDLVLMVIVVAVSFVIGLLPSGTDNFSHIGGFVMGLAEGIVILHSPSSLRRRIGEDDVYQVDPRATKRKEDSLIYGTTGESSLLFFKSPLRFFKGRKPLWWVWWLFRAGFLVAVLVAFIVLINNFYTYRSTCSWCKYLSCLPVNGWCDVQNFTQPVTSTVVSRSLPAPTPPPLPVRLF